MKAISSWHVGVAAEAFAAALFARLGYDVSVQYGANQPEYDLIAVSGESNHHKKTIFCLVQFKGTEDHEMPRMYLASPVEIAEVLKKSAGGRGETILYEYHEWGPRAAGRGTIDRVPDEWRFTAERAKDMFETYGQ